MNKMKIWLMKTIWFKERNKKQYFNKNKIAYNAAYEIWIGRKEGKDPIAKLSYSGSLIQNRSFH